jgi:hypothetical protein
MTCESQQLFDQEAYCRPVPTDESTRMIRDYHVPTPVSRLKSQPASDVWLSTPALCACCRYPFLEPHRAAIEAGLKPSVVDLQEAGR